MPPNHSRNNSSSHQNQNSNNNSSTASSRGNVNVSISGSINSNFIIEDVDLSPVRRPRTRSGTGVLISPSTPSHSYPARSLRTASVSSAISSANGREHNQLPPYELIDFTALGNHFLLIGSVGYFIGNFFRSLIGSSIDSNVTDTFTNSLFFFLSIIFVIESLLYTFGAFDACFKVRRKYNFEVIKLSRDPRKYTQPQRFNSSSSSVVPTLTPRNSRRRSADFQSFNRSESELGISTVAQLQSPVSSTRLLASSSGSNEDNIGHSFSSLGSILRPSESVLSLISNVPDKCEENDSEYSNLYTFFPCSIASAAEFLNILASVINFISSSLPFLPVLQYSDYDAADDYLSYQIYVDTASMTIWAIDALLYFHLWKVADQSSSACRSCATAGLWANACNVVASWVYLASCFYGIVLTNVSYSNNLDPVSRDRLFYREVVKNQRTCAFVGDCLYLACAIFFELDWWKPRPDLVDDDGEAFKV